MPDSLWFAADNALCVSPDNRLTKVHFNSELSGPVPALPCVRIAGLWGPSGAERRDQARGINGEVVDLKADQKRLKKAKGSAGLIAALGALRDDDGHIGGGALRGMHIIQHVRRRPANLWQQAAEQVPARSGISGFSQRRQEGTGAGAPAVLKWRMASSSRLRIVSYNIHKAIGSDGRHRPDRILDVLAETGGDIALLQEADRRFGPRLGVLPRAALHDAGWQAVPLAGHDGGLGWHGNAILLRPGIGMLRHAHIALPRLEPRGAVLADVEVAGRVLRLIGVHLCLTGLRRGAQLAAIARALASQPGPPLPSIIGGDFNDWRIAGLAAPLAENFVMVPPKASFPARLPLGPLDRMLHTPDLRRVDHGVHISPLARTASDHVPVWLDIVFDGK